MSIQGEQSWQVTVDAAVARRREVFADGELAKSMPELDDAEVERLREAFSVVPGDIRASLYKGARLAGEVSVVEIPLPFGNEVDVPDEARPRALVLVQDAGAVYRAVATERGRIEAQTLEGFRKSRIRYEQQQAQLAEQARLAEAGLQRRARWRAIDPTAAAFLSAAAELPSDDKIRQALVSSARAVHAREGMPHTVDEEIEKIVAEMADERDPDALNSSSQVHAPRVGSSVRAMKGGR